MDATDTTGTAPRGAVPTRAGGPPPIPKPFGDGARAFVGRRWVLRQIADWLDHGSERVFLVTGDPGSGKSTLCAWLAGAGLAPEDPEDAAALGAVRSAWAAVHFCTTKGPGGSVDPRDFTRSVARQLASRYPLFGELAIAGAPEYGIHIHQDVKENLGEVVGIRATNLFVTGSSPADVYAVAVREPLNALLARSPGLRVPILVDGLDEALASSPPNIPQLLADGALPEGVRLLVTSRNERRVTEALSDGFGDLVRLNLSKGEAAERSRSDIREYVAKRLAEPALAPALNGRAGAGSPQAVTDRLATQAAGNFLYAEVMLDGMAAGGDGRQEATGVPGELFDLYRSTLNRLMPDMERYGQSDTWLERYQPLLGMLSVALPAAPVATLARWLGWSESTVSARLDDLSQIVQFDPSGGGSFRLYHTSMADFLAAERHAGGELNRYYVDPCQQHDRIARYYLEAAAGEGPAYWAACDEYGLRRLAWHMRARLEAAAPGRRLERWKGELYGIVREPRFQRAQRALPDGSEVAVASTRIALEAALAGKDLGEAGRLIDELAPSMETGLRGLAVEGLVRLHALDPKAAIARIVALLGQDAVHVWGVGLKAAHLIGPGAQEVFRWIALKGSGELLQAASCALSLRWHPGTDDFALDLLESLTEQVSLARLRRSYKIASFVADVTINIYINHCDQVELAYRVSNLCHTMLKERLRLNLINQPFLERILVSPAVAGTLATRALDATLVAELQDPARVFGAPAAEKERFRVLIPLFDPEQPLGDHAGDLRALLESEIVLYRVLAAIVLGAHACHDFEAARPALEALFEPMGARGRLWVLIGFVVLLPDTPPAWIPLLEALTRRFVTEHTAEFLDRQWETLATFDFALLPLGLAYGKRGQRMAYFEEAMLAAAERGDRDLVGRFAEGLGLVGFYYPEAVLRLLGDAITDWSDPALRPSLVHALALMRTLHFDAVDLFLRRVGAEHLAGEIAARSDIDMVRRYVDRVGFLNYTVNACVRYPAQRKAFVQDSFQLLAEVPDRREFLRQYAPTMLRMLREADYQPIRWEGREPKP